MTPGKAAAQAGHAFLDSFQTATHEATEAYLAEGGTKIVLSAANGAVLARLYEEVSQHDIPCAQVIECNHVMPPSFDGSPILTAIGIGPLSRSKARPFTKKFSLMK